MMGYQNKSVRLEAVRVPILAAGVVFLRSLVLIFGLWIGYGFLGGLDEWA